MMEFTCETIGLTEEELQNRVVDGICQQLLSSKYVDYDEGEYVGKSELMRKLESQIEKMIDEKVEALGNKYVKPNVDALIENLVLTETNNWGEKKRKEVTFIEYLTQRADDYMTEKVDFEGKTKKEKSYGWSAKQERLMYMIDSHLQYKIDNAVKQSLKGLTAKISGGLDGFIRQEIDNFASKLKASIK